MTRFKVLTLASAIATAFAVPAALAQQSGMPNSQTGTPDSSSRVQQRDATGNPSASPTQPPRSTTGANDPTLRSGSATRDRSTMGHGQYDSSTLRNVQQALQNKGYDVGPIDGVMGPRTKSALREFQQQQGLTRSGQLDQQTMSALDVQASASGRAGTMDRSAVPGGDRSGAGTSGTSAAGGSPSPSAGGSSGTTGSSAERSGTMGDRSGSTSGTTPDRSGPTSGTTPDRSGTGSSGTSAIGGSPSGGATGSGGTTGGRTGGRTGG